MSSDSESDDFKIISPPEIKNTHTAQEVLKNSLPEKSRDKYDKTYNDFILWKSSKNAQSFSENVLLSYFSEKAQKYKPSTLWSTYSMLKSSLSVKNNVNIKEYAKLIAFLKQKSEGFRSKKSKVLTMKDVFDFLQNAPDNNYLLMKVILILGINGACRSQELLDLTVDNIEIREDIAIVKLPRTKTKIERSFVVTDTFFHILKRYMNLRPSNMNSKRVLLQFKNNKCVRQVIGKNKIGSVPKEIASYLKLANPELYTGHCLKRTSATILADTGTDLTAIKQHGGWKSSAVAESYIEDSIENKKDINNQISGSIILHKKKSPQPSTSTEPTAPLEEYDSNLTIKPSSSTNTSATAEQSVLVMSQTSHSSISLSGKNVTITLSNCDNFNINFS